MFYKISSAFAHGAYGSGYIAVSVLQEGGGDLLDQSTGDLV